MFDIDNWTEIFDSIKKNKLRTFLTGFSISWGIFMFIILLATSNGIQNGLAIVFENQSSNVIQMKGRLTSIPYKGLPDNRKINLDQKDYDLLNQGTPEKEYLSALITVDITANYKKQYTTCQCTGIYPEYSHIGGIKMVDNQGRCINDMDIKEKRKVAIINNRLKEVLYGLEDPVGKTILINGMKFTVIGVFNEIAIVDIEKAYIPFSTAQLLFNGGWGFESLAFTIKNVKTNVENEAFNKRLIENLSEIHQFDSRDKTAINLSNQMKNYLQAIGTVNAMVIFIWIIGIGTLFAGMVGISNIMLITVRERTKEFGIRKALGASPSSILKEIILESICITTVFGYIGLLSGIFVNGMFNLFLKNHPERTEFAIFNNPMVDMNVAVGAMVVLIIAGVVAGYFPAHLAVRIMPVEAMRSEG